MAELLDHQRYVIFTGPQQLKAPCRRYIAHDGTSTELKSKAAKFLTIADAIAFAKQYNIQIDVPSSIGIENFNSLIDSQLADDIPAS